MELLLIDDVPGLGSRGDLVTVAKGYARNYLLPKGLARVPTEQAVVEVRARAEKIKAEEQAVVAERMDQAKTLAEAAVRLAMKASEEGHLYGSVGPRQVSEALAEQGFEVEERHVALESPLKEVGEYEVMISLHPEVQVPVKVTVVSEDEA
jgi:large subunit ribosomal protein L9